MRCVARTCCASWVFQVPSSPYARFSDLARIAGWGGKPWETLVFMAGKIAIEWLLLWYLYRNKTFLRV
jgi:hypothetical protein